jgi:hypothetical protein
MHRRPIPLSADVDFAVIANRINAYRLRLLCIASAVRAGNAGRHDSMRIRPIFDVRSSLGINLRKPLVIPNRRRLPDPISELAFSAIFLMTMKKNPADMKKLCVLFQHVLIRIRGNLANRINDQCHFLLHRTIHLNYPTKKISLNLFDGNVKAINRFQWKKFRGGVRLPPHPDLCDRPMLPTQGHEFPLELIRYRNAVSHRPADPDSAGLADKVRLTVRTPELLVLARLALNTRAKLVPFDRRNENLALRHHITLQRKGASRCQPR